MRSSSSRVFSVEQEGIQQEARVDHPLLMPSTVEGRPGTNVATAAGGGGGQATEMRARLTKSLSLKRQKYDNVDEKGNGKNHYRNCDAKPRFFGHRGKLMGSRI